MRTHTANTLALVQADYTCENYGRAEMLQNTYYTDNDVYTCVGWKK